MSNETLETADCKSEDDLIYEKGYADGFKSACLQKLMSIQIAKETLGWCAATIVLDAPYNVESSKQNIANLKRIIKDAQYCLERIK